MTDCTHELLVFSFVYPPPQCSAAGTGWCQRGRGWRWWCGRSWQGLGPTGNPGSQRPVFLKPTPKGWERERKKRKRQILSGSHVAETNCLSCGDSELRGTFLGLPKRHSPWNGPRKMAAYMHSMATWSGTAHNILKAISFHLTATGWQSHESTWTAWVVSLRLWERPEVKTGSFVK